MNIVPFDIGSYLVQSRRCAHDWYLVDLIDWTCSCDGYQNYQTCAHIQEVRRQRIYYGLTMIVGMTTCKQ